MSIKHNPLHLPRQNLHRKPNTLIMRHTIRNHPILMTLIKETPDPDTPRILQKPIKLPIRILPIILRRKPRNPMKQLPELLASTSQRHPHSHPILIIIQRHTSLLPLLHIKLNPRHLIRHLLHPRNRRIHRPFILLIINTKHLTPLVEICIRIITHHPQPRNITTSLVHFITKQIQLLS